MDSNKIEGIEKEEFLLNVKDEFEASIIEAKLSQAQIPVLRKYKETGTYNKIYFGNTIYGIDLYVPSKLFDLASELVKVESIQGSEELYDMNMLQKGISEDDINEEDINENDVKEEDIKIDDSKYQKYKKVFVWIIIFTFIPGFLLSAFFTIGYLLKEIGVLK